MTKYDKELDTRTDDFDEAIEPLEREAPTDDEQKRDVEDGD